MEVAYEITGLQFRDAQKVLPDRDDDYLVLLAQNAVQKLSYTVEGGWNTHRSFYDGSVSDNAGFDPAWVLGWAEWPEWWKALRSCTKRDST